MEIPKTTPYDGFRADINGISLADAYRSGLVAGVRLITTLDFKVTTIGVERSAPDRTQIRFLFEEEYQELLSQVQQ